MIEIRELQKNYGPTRAVDGISFTIQRGEIVGLLGPNGAGKSTTIRMLTTYLAPDGGTISVDGIDVEADPIGVRNKVGYMPESAPLYTDMRVLDYLHFVAAARRLNPRSPEGEKRIAWSIGKCGLHDVLRKSIGALSKGYRQRVALAQAIVHDPEILILDEPTSGLDPNQIREIRDLILELGRAKTVLLSTHILQEVNAVCDRAIIINRGRIAADGTLDELQRDAHTGTSFTVGIAGEPGQIEAALTALPGVARVQALVHNGVCRFQVDADETDADLGGQVFTLVTEKGWQLNELAPIRLSIEEVFHQLTEEG